MQQISLNRHDWGLPWWFLIRDIHLSFLEVQKGGGGSSNKVIRGQTSVLFSLILDLWWSPPLIAVGTGRLLLHCFVRCWGLWVLRTLENASIQRDKCWYWLKLFPFSSFSFFLFFFFDWVNLFVFARCIQTASAQRITGTGVFSKCVETESWSTRYSLC